jgi:hypothetical protein
MNDVASWSAMHIAIWWYPEYVEKTEGFARSCRIDYLIYARQRKYILGTCLIKARVVNSHPPFLILLLYKYRVSKTLGVEYFSNEP